MKKLFLLLFALISLSSFAQALTPSGYYKGKIVTSENTYFYAYFYVNVNGEVRQINYDENTYKTFADYKTINNNNSTVYTWANNGGVWSETQTFVFTVNTTTGDVHLRYLRVVQNVGEDPWIVLGAANVERYYR